MVQPPPEWKHHFLPLVGGVIQCPLHSKQEGKEDKHSHGQDLVRERQGSKAICDGVQPTCRLIPNLQNGVAYTTFLNGLLSGIFKFFLVESKVTTLVDVLRRAQDFIEAIEICYEDDFVWQDT